MVIRTILAGEKRLGIARGVEKEKSRQDSKDRSESRISVLMGRKRGKVSEERVITGEKY